MYLSPSLRHWIDHLLTFAKQPVYALDTYYSSI